MTGGRSFRGELQVIEGDPQIVRVRDPDRPFMETGGQHEVRLPLRFPGVVDEILRDLFRGEGGVQRKIAQQLPVQITGYGNPLFATSPTFSLPTKCRITLSRGFVYKPLDVPV